MIDRLSGRDAFARLAREGVRRGRGPIRLVSRVVPDHGVDHAGDGHARIAFAIPRSVGNAVTRNRIRRRIRGVLTEIATEHPDLPPPGEHLIRVTAPLDDWSHAMLRCTVIELLTATSAGETS